MGITTAANSKFGIGTTLAATTAAEFAEDDFVDVANIQDLGEAGSTAEINTGKFVDQAYVRKLKGSRNNGSMTLVVGRDSADPGYAALIAAEKTSHAYNFKVELNDKPAAGASPKNSVFYFRAIVASARNQFGGADDLVTTTFELAISGAIVEVLASAT